PEGIHGGRSLGPRPPPGGHAGGPGRGRARRGRGPSHRARRAAEGQGGFRDRRGHLRGGGGAPGRRRFRRRVGARGRGPGPLPPRPRRPALLHRSAATIEGTHGLGQPRLPAPPHRVRDPPALAGERRLRAMREDQPRPGGPAAERARELSGARAGRRIARNTLFSGVGEASNLILFLLGFLAARWLAPTAFGEYSTAFAFVGLFRLLPDFGMSSASTLAISRDRSIAARTAANLLGFQALLSALTLALCLGLGRTLYRDVTWIAVLVLSFDLVLKSVKSTLRWLLKGLERFGVEALSLLVERTAILVLGAASLAAGGGVVGFVLAFAAVRLLDTAGLAAYVHARVLPLRLAFDRRVWLDLFRRGLPFAYAGLMITLFFQV